MDANKYPFPSISILGVQNPPELSQDSLIISHTIDFHLQFHEVILWKLPIQYYMAQLTVQVATSDPCTCSLDFPIAYCAGVCTCDMAPSTHGCTQKWASGQRHVIRVDSKLLLYVVFAIQHTSTASAFTMSIREVNASHHLVINHAYYCIDLIPSWVILFW